MAICLGDELGGEMGVCWGLWSLDERRFSKRVGDGAACAGEAREQEGGDNAGPACLHEAAARSDVSTSRVIRGAWSGKLTREIEPEPASDFIVAVT